MSEPKPQSTACTCWISGGIGGLFQIRGQPERNQLEIIMKTRKLFNSFDFMPF
jgi:hypothetical protein